MAISIRQTLRQDGKANPKDVLTVKKALVLTGHYEIPDYGLTPYPDKKLFQAIKDYQKSSGLKVDGVIAPYGETLLSLKKDIRYKNLNQNDDEDYEEDDPGNKSPILRCVECGGPHGGAMGDLCEWCDKKS